MTDQKTKRRIARLEQLLEAERERAEKGWGSYRDTLRELVDAKMKLRAIERVLQGVDDVWGNTQRGDEK